jgi:hypothetical protein
MKASSVGGSLNFYPNRTREPKCTRFFHPNAGTCDTVLSKTNSSDVFSQGFNGEPLVGFHMADDLFGKRPIVDGVID